VCKGIQDSKYIGRFLQEGTKNEITTTEKTCCRSEETTDADQERHHCTRKIVCELRKGSLKKFFGKNIQSSDFLFFR